MPSCSTWTRSLPAREGARTRLRADDAVSMLGDRIGDPATVGNTMTIAGRIIEVWRFREVIRNFVSQDLKVKYRRSVLGFFWSMLHPLLMIIILSLVFTRLFRFEDVPHYPLYILSGLLPWTFFATCVDGCSVSILNNEAYVKRQYFPKLVFPIALVMQNLVTFVLSMVALLAILGWFIGFRITPALAMLPLSCVCLISAALGLGAIVATLTVYFRDTQHLVSVAINALFYLSPIIWPIEEMERRGVDQYFRLNPMLYVMRMFRAPLHEGVWPSETEILVACGTSVTLLVIGLAVFWLREDDLIFRL